MLGPQKMKLTFNFLVSQTIKNKILHSGTNILFLWKVEDIRRERGDNGQFITLVPKVFIITLA